MQVHCFKHLVGSYIFSEPVTFSSMRLLFILICLTCFGLQVYEQVVKFYHGSIVSSIYSEKNSEAKLPSVSFCPGVKHWKLEMEDFSQLNMYNINELYPWPKENGKSRCNHVSAIIYFKSS